MYIAYTMWYDQVIKTTKTLTVDEPGKHVKQYNEAQKDKCCMILTERSKKQAGG